MNWRPEGRTVCLGSASGWSWGEGSNIGCGEERSFHILRGGSWETRKIESITHAYKAVGLWETAGLVRRFEYRWEHG